jgi:hypothetical protein
VLRGGKILMKSSIRRMVMAASVANRRDFTLLIAGSTTPALRLFTTCTSGKGVTTKMQHDTNPMKHKNNNQGNERDASAF